MKKKPTMRWEKYIFCYKNWIAKKMLKEENNFIVDMKNVYNNNVKNDWEIFKNKQKKYLRLTSKTCKNHMHKTHTHVNLVIIEKRKDFI